MLLRSLRLPTSAALGRVLTSDANGNATWQAAPSGDAGTFTGGNAFTVFAANTPLIRAGGAS